MDKFWETLLEFFRDLISIIFLLLLPLLVFYVGKLIFYVVNIPIKVVKEIWDRQHERYIKEMIEKQQKELQEKQQKELQKELQKWLKGCPLCNSDNIRHLWKYEEFLSEYRCSGCGCYSSEYDFKINSALICKSCDNQYMFSFLLCPKCHSIANVVKNSETYDLGPGDVDHMHAGCIGNRSTHYFFEYAYCFYCGFKTSSASLDCEFEIPDGELGSDLECKK